VEIDNFGICEQMQLSGICVAEHVVGPFAGEHGERVYLFDKQWFLCTFGCPVVNMSVVANVTIFAHLVITAPFAGITLI
jgi:hypothetical protein